MVYTYPTIHHPDRLALYIYICIRDNTQALSHALSLRPNTEEDGASWLSPDEAEGGAVVTVAEREDIPLALDQHERRMPWDRRCVHGFGDMEMYI